MNGLINLCISFLTWLQCGHTLDHRIALVSLGTAANGSMTLGLTLGTRCTYLGKLAGIMTQTHVARFALNAIVIRLTWFRSFGCARWFYLLEINQ